MKLLEQTNLLDAPSPKPRVPFNYQKHGISIWCCGSRHRTAGVRESNRPSCSAISPRQRPASRPSPAYRSEHASQPVEAENRLAKEQLECLQVLGRHLVGMRSTVAVEESDRPDADADRGEDG